MSADIELDRVTIRFGDFTAVKDVSLNIDGGEFFSILGPSGCGKTTLLRTISGFLEPTAGAVRIGGQDMAGIGSNKRPTALIFQNLALFPLMSVAENIGYGLRVRGVPRQGAAAQGRRIAARSSRCRAQGDKRIGELSGGQKQRVAVARALAVEPQGAAARRAAVGARSAAAPAHARRIARDPEARRHHLHLHHARPGRGADHVRPHRGDERRRVEQVGDGRAVYDDPATPFVASFVGENNGVTGARRATLADGMAELDTPLGRAARAATARGLALGARGDPVRAPRSAALRAAGKARICRRSGRRPRSRATSPMSVCAPPTATS